MATDNNNNNNKLVSALLKTMKIREVHTHAGEKHAIRAVVTRKALETLVVLEGELHTQVA